jgi:hypothetical protein
MKWWRIASSHIKKTVIAGLTRKLAHCRAVIGRDESRPLYYNVARRFSIAPE